MQNNVMAIRVKKQKEIKRTKAWSSYPSGSTLGTVSSETFSDLLTVGQTTQAT